MAKFVEVIEGPARVGYRSIKCRRCAAEMSKRIDSTWRHDADGTIACVDPDQLYRDAEKAVRSIPWTVPCDCCGADATRRRGRCTDCLIDGCEPGTSCRR